MNTIRIESGVLDTERLSLIDKDGNEIIIKQGDPRLRPIVDFITVPMTTLGYVELPKDMLEINTPQDTLPYAEYEQKTNGAVRFFRVAKSLLKKFLGSGDKESAQHARTRLIDEEIIPSQSWGSVKTPRELITQAAVAEILATGVPASDPSFRSDTVSRQKPIQNDGRTSSDSVSKPGTLNDDSSTDTIVAIVDNKIVTGVEKIESQVKRANETGQTKGVQNLLKRLGEVISERGHTADDVLRFLQRADMSVADNGDIIALKALMTSNSVKFSGLGAPEEQYVDGHSKNVHQWIGAIVQMPLELVDKNRNNECSVGLHIARRGYLNGGFSSCDVCTLVIIHPEDVVAVPEYDANKIRVRKYQIVGKLTRNQKEEIWRNRPFTTKDNGDVLLANLIKGNYPKATHLVQIGGEYGSKLTVIRLDGKTQEDLDKEAAPKEKAPKLDKSIKEAALPNSVVVEPVVDKPVDMVSVQAKIGGTRAQQAKTLYDAWVKDNCRPDGVAYAELMAFKKKTKISWSALGLPSSQSGNLLPPGETPTKATKAPAKPKAASTKATPANPPTKVKKAMTPREELAVVLKDVTPETLTAAKAEKANDIKKFAKKGWGVLGVSPEMERAIKKKLDK